jgi:hypothetical protein
VDAAGLALTHKLFETKLFFGLRRRHTREGYRHELLPYETSRKAVDLFFEKAQSLKICAPAARSQQYLPVDGLTEELPKHP